MQNANLRPPSIHHASRVGHMSVRIAERLRLGAKFLKDLAEAVPLHDIGKLTIPPWILTKRGTLSDYERALMQTHTLAGARLLRGTGEPALELAAEIAESHHERWDGHGYPHGLRAREIPLGGRIVAVADVFDALLNERPYKPAWPHEAAVDEVVANAGSQFDPEVVEAFLSCVNRVAPAASGLHRRARLPLAPMRGGSRRFERLRL